MNGGPPPEAWAAWQQPLWVWALWARAGAAFQVSKCESETASFKMSWEGLARPCSIAGMVTPMGPADAHACKPGLRGHCSGDPGPATSLCGIHFP